MEEEEEDRQASLISILMENSADERNLSHLCNESRKDLDIVIPISGVDTWQQMKTKRH